MLARCPIIRKIVSLAIRHLETKLASEYDTNVSNCRLFQFSLNMLILVSYLIPSDSLWCPLELQYAYFIDIVYMCVSYGTMHCTVYIINVPGYARVVSMSDKTSYNTMSLRFEALRCFVFKITCSLWHLSVVSAALLPRRL